MKSQPQNPEFRNNPKNFDPCICASLRETDSSGFATRTDLNQFALMQGLARI